MKSSDFPVVPANTETPAMSAYRWLLILGFPENVAAANVLAQYHPPSAAPAAPPASATGAPSPQVHDRAA